MNDIEDGDVVIFSGGLDSTALLWRLIESPRPLVALSFNYGQRHVRELASASDVLTYADSERSAAGLPLVRRRLINMEDACFGGALTGEVDVPLGHYEDPSMRATVVPARNAIMIAAAVGCAVREGVSRVSFGAHAGDYAVYHDCRPYFVSRMNDAMAEGYGVHVTAPLVHMTKGQVVLAAAAARAPLHLTWSCYLGGELHCGKCGTCVERREAFVLAHVTDPTEYAA